MVDRADDHYVLNISRARALLGWEPQRSLRATLPAMVAALKANPLRWYREHKLKPSAWLRANPGSGLPAPGRNCAGQCRPRAPPA